MIVVYMSDMPKSCGTSKTLHLYCHVSLGPGQTQLSIRFQQLTPYSRYAFVNCHLCHLFVIFHAIYILGLSWIALPYCPLPPTPYPFSLFLIGYTLLIRDCQFEFPCYGGIFMTHTPKSSSPRLQLTCQCFLLETGN